MTELILHPGYCSEHSDTRHMIDDAGNCHNNIKKLEALGLYYYAGHLGRGYYRYVERRQPTRQEQLFEKWADARQDAQDDKAWTTEPDF
jgi:hypothetical protein